MSPASAARTSSSRPYAVGYGRGTAHMATRRAEIQAAFLLPHLLPGMRLLDCGCGPGTITVGLARCVNPGEAVGIDIAKSEVETASLNARKSKAGNARFEEASAYDLPFPDSSFDVVYTNGLLEHLSERERAIAEMYRVLKPGGLAAVRTPALGTCIWWPHIETVRSFLDLWTKVGRLVGADFDVATRMPDLMASAGFEDMQLTASFTYDTHGGKVLAARMRDQEMADLAVKSRIISRARLTALLDEMDSWTALPGATALSAWGEVLARKPEKNRAATPPVARPRRKPAGETKTARRT